MQGNMARPKQGEVIPLFPNLDDGASFDEAATSSREPPLRPRLPGSTLGPGQANEILTTLAGVIAELVEPEPEPDDLDFDVSYFGDPDDPVSLVRIEALFAAAKAFRKRKPQTLVGPVDVFQIDVPAFEVEGAAAVVIEHDRRPLLAVYPSLEAWQRDVELDTYTPPLQLAFLNKRDLAFNLHRELNLLPFAARRGPHPVLVAMDNDELYLPENEDYAMVSAVAGAIASLVTPVRMGRFHAAGEAIEDEADIDVGGEQLRVGLRLPHRGPPARLPVTRQVYRIKVSLRGARPPIWRRIEVDPALTLAALHEIIQLAMGWENCHLHSFEHGRTTFGPPNFDLADRDEAKVRLGDLGLRVGAKLRYTYDFGDSWEHELRVEAIEAAEGPQRPRCIAGRRAGPPEDCGGVWGLAELLANPQARAGLGFGYDPESFSVAATDALLERYFRPR